MKIYDLSQPLNQDCSFWPFYPPFEVKYIKRKSEHGVNAQYIQTSNHMGTHLDAPRHFVTNGKTVDQIPLEWLFGLGVIVDLSDVLDELDVFTPEMLDERAEIKEGDILFINTGWHKYTFLSPDGDEEKYCKSRQNDASQRWVHMLKHLLQAHEIPRRFGWICCNQRICQLFKWCIFQEREKHQKER